MCEQVLNYYLYITGHTHSVTLNHSFILYADQVKKKTEALVSCCAHICFFFLSLKTFAFGKKKKGKLYNIQFLHQVNRYIFIKTKNQTQ